MRCVRTRNIYTTFITFSTYSYNYYPLGGLGLTETCRTVDNELYKFDVILTVHRR